MYQESVLMVALSILSLTLSLSISMRMQHRVVQAKYFELCKLNCPASKPTQCNDGHKVLLYRHSPSQYATTMSSIAGRIKPCESLAIWAAGYAAL
jgi:hypothetical protein